MRGATLLLLAAFAALPGCRVFDKWTKNRPRDAEPAARDRDKIPKSWLDDPARPAEARVPKATTWDDPRNPGFDLKAETRGMLAGIVVDPDGQPVPYLDVAIDLADPAQGGGAPVTAQTDRRGLFVIQGLKPNAAYTLSATVKQNGKVMTGQSVVKPPQQTIKLTLRDDLAPPSGGRSAAVFDPPQPARPPGRDPATLPYPAENLPPDGSWNPVAPGGRAPADPRPAPAPRGDLVAPGPYPEWRPPPASIPNGSGNLLPPPNLESKYRGESVKLLDAQGKTAPLPPGLTLVEFMTTTCGPCKRALPALNATADQFPSLNVVLVACDDAGERDRRRMADRYAAENRLRLPVLIEPGDEPGAMYAKYGVTVFPTAVLLDSAGKALWKGDPRRAAEVAAAVRAARGD
jgi:thiol-disulfide isomerase/thioredoxin